MSLQVWLPLNGSLENLGLDSFNFTQSIVSGYEDGKIGKALQMKNSNADFMVPSLINAKEFSVAFWYKAIADDTITTNWNKVLRFQTKNADGTSGSDFRFESSYATTAVDTYGLSVHNNSSQSMGAIGHQIIGSKGSWHHACFTHTPTDNYTYLDGVQIRYGVGAAGTLTGRIIIAGASPYPNGLMNDLRIYDHALSAKEVKELSKGLVAHYPLNDFSINPNETVIYDCSGYGRNCTISDNPPVVNSNTPRYSSCMFFENGTVNYAYHDNFQASSDAITMNFWFRSNGAIGYSNFHEFFGIGGRYFENSMNANGLYRNGFYINDTRYCSDYGDTNLLTDLKWHMLSATYDGTAIKRYIDGELVNTTNVSGTLTNSPMQLNIGRLNSTEPYAANEIYLSDLRIYCTALSAEDIKELYETSVSIDDKGNFHAYEISEV